MTTPFTGLGGLLTSRDIRIGNVDPKSQLHTEAQRLNAQCLQMAHLSTD